MNIWRRRTALAAVLLFLAIGLGSRWAARFYTELLWYDDLGFADVFWRRIAWAWGVGSAAVLFGAAFLGLNMRATRGTIAKALFRYQHRLPSSLPWTSILRAPTIIGVLIGAISGLSAAEHWPAAAAYWHRVPFGWNDPLFAKDAGFFVFELPLHRLIHTYLLSLALLALILSGALYLLAGALRFADDRLQASPESERHLTLLGAAAFLLLAWGFHLSGYDLVYAQGGIVASGAGFTDEWVRLPAYRLLSALCVAAAAVLAAFPRMKRKRLIYWPIAGVAAVYLLGMGVVPAAVERFVVEPDEFARQAPYLERHIEATRRSFNLHRIRERTFSGQARLDPGAVDRNPGTMANIRIWDWSPLTQTFHELEGLRAYYRFPDVDIDRYRLGGRLRQVTLAPREIDISRLPNATWVNTHLQYTHGYGLVVSPVNEVSPEGLPQWWLRGVPPQGLPEFALDRPEIYFGLLTDHFVVVRTEVREFSPGGGDRDIMTVYEGEAGVPLSNLLRRAAFAIRLQSPQLFFSTAITAQSRILMHRNVQARLQRIAPFLRFDRDPYIVLVDGRLQWIADAYTVSDSAPYALSVAGWGNYARNSVKAVVDAYEGRVRFFLADDEDPLARAYASMFPGLFEPLSQMPEGVREHLRYPEDLFTIQAELLTRYHVTDPQVFYNQENRWQIAQEVRGNQIRPMEPYYLVMQLPGEEEEEMIFMLPFTAEGRPNMIGWLAARNDGERLGEMELFRFPTDVTTLGPQHIDARIDQHPEISERITLWSQQGSDVIRGHILVIPVEDGLVYVEPVYLQALHSPMPELVRVIVVHGSTVAMAETLSDALELAFGAANGAREGRAAAEEAFSDPSTGPASVLREPGADLEADGPSAAFRTRELAASAQRAFEQARERAAAGDWAGYGEALAELDRLLQEMVSVAEAPAE